MQFAMSVMMWTNTVMRNSDKVCFVVVFLKQEADITKALVAILSNE